MRHLFSGVPKKSGQDQTEIRFRGGGRGGKKKLGWGTERGVIFERGGKGGNQQAPWTNI